MKNLFILSFMAFLSVFTQAQTTDNFSLKVGVIGGWLSYEKPLTNQMTVVGELGYIGGFYKNQYLNHSGSLFTTSLGLEGRYYYNFNRRTERGKNIENNAANYFSVDMVYIPDFLTTSSEKDIQVLKTFNVFAKYGFKRNFSSKLNYEIAFGPGYMWGENKISESTFGLDIKFAYVF